MEQKLSFKKRLLISLLLLVIGSGFVLWLMLKPEHEFHHYRLNDCENSYLTAIVYWKIGERGVILAKGRHEEVPTENFIIYDDLSGFDASFSAVVTCERGTVIVNTYSSYFDEQEGAEDIRPRDVDSDMYVKLVHGGSGTEIYLY